MKATLMRGPGAGGGTIRIGRTVRRAPDRTPPAMIPVLKHLEETGFTKAPRVLGKDGLDRWILTYIPGRTAIPPYRSWAATDQLLRSVARLLREYHDAMLGFPAIHSLSQPAMVPSEYQGTLVGHLDVSMANVVVHGAEAVGLIDFEEICLAAAIWDVARTVRHWVPLIDPDDLPEGLTELRGRHLSRLVVFADAYGLEEADRACLIDAVIANADMSYQRMRAGAIAGHPGYTREWTGYAAVRNRRGRRWVETHRAELERALTSEPSTIGGRDDVSS